MSVRSGGSCRVLSVTPTIGVASSSMISLWQKTADYAWQTETQSGSGTRKSSDWSLSVEDRTLYTGFINLTVDNAKDVFPVARKVSILKDQCWPSGLVSRWRSS